MSDSKKFRPKRLKSKLNPASDVLQCLLKDSKSALADGFTRWRLEKEWPAIVGESIAQHSLPVGYRKGVLYLWVEHSAWIQELNFFKPNIMCKVNEYLGASYARDIKFTLDRKASNTPKESK